jgi:hypothetical protein
VISTLPRSVAEQAYELDLVALKALQAPSADDHVDESMQGPTFPREIE